MNTVVLALWRHDCVAHIHVALYYIHMLCLTPEARAEQAEIDLMNIKASLEAMVSVLQKTHPYDDDIEKLQACVMHA